MKYNRKLPKTEYESFYISSKANIERNDNPIGNNDISITEIEIGKLIAKRKNGLWGLYDKDGKEIIPHILDAIDNNICDGLLVGRIKREEKKPGEIEKNKYIYFDENGDIVLDIADHARMGQFYNGVALVEDEECLGTYYGQYEYRYLRYFVDKEGKRLTPSKEFQDKITIDNWMIIEFLKRQDYSEATAIFSHFGYSAYDEYKQIVEQKEKEKQKVFKKTQV